MERYIQTGILSDFHDVMAWPSRIRAKAINNLAWLYRFQRYWGNRKEVFQGEALRRDTQMLLRLRLKLREIFSQETMVDLGFTPAQRKLVRRMLALR